MRKFQLRNVFLSIWLVYWRHYFTFFFINLKKINSQNVTTDLDDFERQLYTPTQLLYTIIYLKRILKHFSTILILNFYLERVSSKMMGKSFRENFAFFSGKFSFAGNLGRVLKGSAANRNDETFEITSLVLLNTLIHLSISSRSIDPFPSTSYIRKAQESLSLGINKLKHFKFF